MTHVKLAKQGHLYKCGEREVIAMQSGVVVEVRPIDFEQAYPLGWPIVVKASWLTPLPMKYFGGSVPK